MHLGRTTLSKFLIQQSDRVEGASDLAALLIDVAAAVKAISAMTAKGALGGVLGKVGASAAHWSGPVTHELDSATPSPIAQREKPCVGMPRDWPSNSAAAIDQPDGASGKPLCNTWTPG